jgi:dTDP-4-amino-4,6-dideoxygalactose transaminase
MKIEVYSPTIRRREMNAVLTALVDDKVGPGEEAKLLVQTAREYLGFDYCLALRSPVLALHIALRALNLEARKGVVISALSPRYYERVIGDLGLRPLYCDVSPSRAVPGRDTVEPLLNAEKDAGCIVLHHTLGFVPDSAAVAELGLPLIEDCSESFGSLPAENAGGPEGSGEGAANAGGPGGAASAPGKYVPGAAGVFTILGLEERDMLTSGGGALLYGVNRRDASVLRGYGDLPEEYGLPDMNAAMAAVQFREAAKNLQKRKMIAAQYLQSSLRTRHKRFLGRDEVEYNNYAFPLVLESGMKEVKAYGRKKDIAVESAFEHTLAGSGRVPEGCCPEARSLLLRTALFPLYPRLGAREIEGVSKLILTLP